MTTPTKPQFPDYICLLIGPRVLDERSTLLALDPVMAVFVQRFKERHQLFSERIYNRQERRAALQHMRAFRRECRDELLEQELQAWENVPMVGTTFERRKSRQQVREERLALCPSGRPSNEVSNVQLIRTGNEMLRYLTGDSPLARAWPADHLERLQRAIHALEAADQPVRDARVALKQAFLALHQERLLWSKDFLLLRDNTLRLVEDGLLADRMKALFTDWTVEKPATTRKKAALAEQERLKKELEEQERLAREALEVQPEEEESAT